MVKSQEVEKKIFCLYSKVAKEMEKFPAAFHETGRALIFLCPGDYSRTQNNERGAM